MWKQFVKIVTSLVNGISTVAISLRYEGTDVQFQDNAENENINRRALDKSAKTYELEKFERNKMLIFNQINVAQYLGHEPRFGSEKDVDALVECFTKRGFDIDCYHDCTKEQLIDFLEKATSQDLSDYGCFAVVMLTHENDDGGLYTQDCIIEKNYLVDCMMPRNAPSLITKPKILIIQTCQGCDYESIQIQLELQSGKRMPYRLAYESDILILISKEPDSRYWLSPSGSWFIQTLCKLIDESKITDEINSIFLRLKRKFSTQKELYYSNDIKKNIPTVMSAFTRQLYLNSKINRKPVVTYNIMEQIQLRRIGKNPIADHFSSLNHVRMLSRAEVISFGNNTRILNKRRIGSEAKF